MPTNKEKYVRQVNTQANILYIKTTQMKTHQIQGTKTLNRAQREDATIDTITLRKDKHPE